MDENLGDIDSMRFGKLMKNLMKDGLLVRCHVNKASIGTLSNGTYHHNMKSCYTMASADCSDHPHYAVFTKIMPDTGKMAVKVYLGGDVVESIAKDDTTFEVNVNGEVVTGDLKEGYLFPIDDPQFPIFSVIQTGSLISIYSKPTGIQVGHFPTNVEIFVPSKYRNEHCGLCGDFNNNPEPSVDLIGPHGCSLAADQMTNAYTLRDETCTESIPKHTKPHHC